MRNNPSQRNAETTWMLAERLRGRTIRQIAADTEAALGRPLGKSEVHKRIEKALAKDRVPATDGVRKMELDRLDDLEVRMRAILGRRHVTINAGKIVRDENGEPLLDDGPWMTATQTLLRIGERRAKLKGLDAPVAVQTDQTVTYKIVGVDPASLT